MKEMEKAEAELEAARSAGKELRFAKEKKDILTFALNQLQQQQQQLQQQQNVVASAATRA